MCISGKLPAKVIIFTGGSLLIGLMMMLIA